MSIWKHWSLEESAEVVTVWIDVAGQTQNVFSADVLRELAEVVSTLEERRGLKRVFFRSAKPHSFFAGADIREFMGIKTLDEAREVSRVGQELFQRIENLSAQTFAIIRGACLGGGLELALACDYRVAVIDPATRLGLPETELGIIPGWGGTQRLPKLIGVLPALGMILQAQKLSASKAFKTGLVDFALKPEELEFFLETVSAKTQKGQHGFKRSWLGWFLNQTGLGRKLTIGAAKKKLAPQFVHYPALAKGLEAIQLSLTHPKQGYQFERDAIAELILSPTCQNLVSLFLNRERARNPATWNIDPALKDQKLSSLAVLGGGTMGAGIAQLAAKSGLKVVLKEVHSDAMNAARERIEQAYHVLVTRGSLTSEQSAAQQNNIEYTTEWEPVEQVPLVVEAVPETMSLKQQIFQELSSRCSEETILASNTSALPITEIGSVVENQGRMAGLHFFNPVHRMDLIEVVKTRMSSQETLGRLIMLCRHLGKTPILVNDSPGFVVNRVLMPYLDEAIIIAIERTARGEDLKEIDQEMKRFGMPMGPLELFDQVGLDVAAHVASSMTVVFGENSLTSQLLQRMLDEGHLGRKTSHGFYSYGNGKKGHITDLRPFLKDLEIELSGVPETPLSNHLSPIQQRLVLAMVNEAGRCLDENVVSEAWMVDLAMVLGTGFAPFHGGPLRFASRLPQSDLLRTLEILAESVGPRYQPARWLKENSGLGIV